MTISGTLTNGPGSRVELPVTGNAPGQYGSLAVTGTANLDGVLALDFRDGYVPSQGDTFTFLASTGGIAGAFDSVAIGGLAPGFHYELTIVDGRLVLAALNDGISSSTVFLPLVTTQP
jgi:hypothetical protein